MIIAGFAKVGVAVAAGAGLAYLFDPDRGRARRARLRDEVRATTRKDWQALERKVHYDRGKVKGLVHQARNRHPGPPADDQALVDRVRSGVFGRMPEIAHHVTVDAVAGVLTLRGQLDDPADIARLEAAVRRVDGVQGLVNLLHTPGQPAPNKAQALRVGAQEAGSGG